MFEALSMTGSLLLSTAYISLSLGWLRGDGKLYPSIGALASLCVMIGSWPLGALQPIIFNGIWLIFSLMAIFSIPLPQLVKTQLPIWCVSGLLFAMAFLLPEQGASLTDQALSGAASASIPLFIGAYLLFIYNALSERAFYLYNVVANGLFFGLMAQTGNTGVLIIIAVGSVMSLIGLLRLYLTAGRNPASAT